MIKRINNHVYIEVKQLEGLCNIDALKMPMHRARNLPATEGNYPAFYNIENPDRLTRADSKRLIMVQTLPDELRQRVLQKIGLTIERVHETLTEVKHNAPHLLMETAINISQKVMEVSAPFVAEQALEFININYQQYLSYYLERRLRSQSVIIYARTCALAVWIYGQHLVIVQRELADKDYRRWKRAYTGTLRTVIDNHQSEFNVYVPLSDRHFAAWVDNVLMKLTANVEVTDIIEVKRAGNTNRNALNAEMQETINYLFTYHTMTKTQIYDKFVAIGMQSDYFVNKETGEISNPPSKPTVFNYIASRENLLMLGRRGAIEYYNYCVPAATRSITKLLANELWSIDGTAHNENVLVNYADGSTKVYQALYKVVIYDVATYRLLAVGIAPVKRKRGDSANTETYELVLDTILQAIRFAGHKPAVLQSDNASGMNKLAEWCKQYSITYKPAAVGHSRSKPVEMLIGQFDMMITRNLANFNGMNMTARSTASRPNASRLGTDGWRTWADAAQWLQTEGRTLWNEHIIETIDKQPVSKTPDELWADKQSYTPELPRMELARMAGTFHEVHLHRDGIYLQHNNEVHLYFPKHKTKEEREKTIQLYSSIPAGKQYSAAKTLGVYVLQYGEPVYVFRKSQYIGEWLPKPVLSHTEGLHGELSDEFKDFLSLQNAFERAARELVRDTKIAIETSDNREVITRVAEEFLTGKRRKTKAAGEYDKAECNAAEIEQKLIEQCTQTNTDQPTEPIQEVEESELMKALRQQFK